MSEESKLASRRILAITEEELNKIILDIHDGPVQNLFAALSLLTGLKQEIQAEPTVDAGLLLTVSRIAEMVEASLHEIKSFVGTFRPPEFQRRNLGPMIEGLVLQHEGWTGHTVDLTIEPLPPIVSLPIKIVLYRILQEALSNAFRHSGAQQEQVRLWSDGDAIMLQIIDNGKGFLPPPLEGPTATEREEHIGLRGMRDRIKLVGGHFQLISKPGEGTQITVIVPVYESKGNETWSNQFE